MFKKIVLTLFCVSLFVCCGCNKNHLHTLTEVLRSDDEQIAPVEGSHPEMHQYRSDNRCMWWDKINKDFVDESMALDIAIAVLKNTDAAMLNEFTTYNRFYQADTDAYYFQFFDHSQGRENKTLCFAISKQNGKILPYGTETLIFDFVSEKMAHDIAIAVVKNMDENFYKVPTTYYLSYREDMDAYFVCSISNSDTNLLGGDLNVVISKKDGEILAYWGGE